MKKRIVSILLVLVITVCALPISAFAADPNVPPSDLQSYETYFLDKNGNYYKVNKNTNVSKGAKWGYVGCIQDLMNKFYYASGNSAYYVGAVDFDFGTKTESAVLTFQANMGLTADGIVGWNTWSMLHTRWLADLHGCKLPNIPA